MKKASSINYEVDLHMAPVKIANDRSMMFYMELKRKISFYNAWVFLQVQLVTFKMCKVLSSLVRVIRSMCV